MSFWKFSEYAPIILRSWCDYADKTSNECVTDKGKYDLGFGRDADSTEYRYYCVCRDSYGKGDCDTFHCLERVDGACDFCPHCGIAERFEIQNHASNTYWCSSWFCSMPSVRMNHDSMKYVWFDDVRAYRDLNIPFENIKRLEGFVYEL